MVLALELFGYQAPSGSIAIPVILAIAAFFIISRSTGGDVIGNSGTGKAGHGPMKQCKRCAVNFQPEQVELMPSGDVRRSFDERCPHCGWDLEWGEPD